MTYYISVTGLQVKTWFHFPLFLFHAIPSSNQAAAAEGNVKSQTTSHNGIMHTLTVWKDKKHMRQYLMSGAHAKAMKATAMIASPDSTRVYGYESETIPSWKEALELWREHGTRHGQAVAWEDSVSSLWSKTIPILVAMTAIWYVNMNGPPSFATNRLSL